MNAALLLALFGRKPELVTVTFNANTTWTVPAGENVLATLNGHGANGTASYNTTSTTWTIDTVYITYYHYPDGHTEQVNSGGSSQTYTSEPTKPADFCAVAVSHTPNGVEGHDSSQVCFYYFKSSTTTGSSYPGATGASATGFGLTFPGGTPSAPTAVTSGYTNVVLNQPSYPIVVPSGATIQITYYL